MQEMTGPERRKAVRIEKIQAHVEFEGLVYKVVNISSDGVLIAANDSNLDAISECGAESGRDLSVSTSRGIDERVLAKMSEGPFRFALLSKASGHASDRGE